MKSAFYYIHKRERKNSLFLSQGTIFLLTSSPDSAYETIGDVSRRNFRYFYFAMS